MVPSSPLFSRLSKTILLSLFVVIIGMGPQMLTAFGPPDFSFPADKKKVGVPPEKKETHLKQQTSNVLKMSKEKIARRDASIKRHADHLKKNGIGTTKEELQAYLDGLFPDAETEKRIKLLIAQLGDANFFKREEAMTKLLGAPSAQMNLIHAAAESKNDLEIRWRARHIREVRSGNSKELLYAVYQLIHLREEKGLAPSVLKSFAYCQQRYLQDIASLALIATSELKDRELLQKTILSQEENRLAQRVASIRSLELLFKEKSDDFLKPLLAEENETVRLTIATALLNHGARDALAVLGTLLESNSVAMRVNAVYALRRSTGKRFKFIAYDAPDKRAVKVAKWKKWITAEGTTAQLLFPLPSSKKGGVKFNRTLVAYYSRNIVVEYDSNGKEVWKQSIIQPWGCQGLENGNRLILSRSSRTVYEYDTSGKLIWKMSGLPGSPSSCQRLENGNTLIACSSAQKVIEVTHENKIIWEAAIAGGPVNASRLDNGRTLIALQNNRKVVEIDARGKVVWEVKNLNAPFSAKRLQNGNTVVCTASSKIVSEYDRSGKIVWNKTGLPYPYDAQRLENGNTIIGDQKGVKEYDSSGKIIWKPQGTNYGSVMRLSRF